MKTKTHHDLCGACTNVSLEHTPDGFPQPGEIAERILSKNPDWSKLHNMIAVAISRRDKMWSEHIKNNKENLYCATTKMDKAKNEPQA